jgi:hypothetical protein
MRHLHATNQPENHTKRNETKRNETNQPGRAAADPGRQRAQTTHPGHFFDMDSIARRLSASLINRCTSSACATPCYIGGSRRRERAGSVTACLVPLLRF